MGTKPKSCRLDQVVSSIDAISQANCEGQANPQSMAQGALSGTMMQSSHCTMT